MAKVLVTGGTGSLGRAVIARLVSRKHKVRLLSRKSHLSVRKEVEVAQGDLESPATLQEAIVGVDAIMHCATDACRSRTVDVKGTEALVRAARENGSPHFVYISIVGVDRSTYGYYQDKHACEEMIEQSGLRWTILRATQFHDLVLRIIRSIRADMLPIVPVPRGMRFQSIDLGEVADRLVGLLERGPVGRAPDIGGPQVRTIEDMTRAYLHFGKRHALVFPLPIPGALIKEFRSGINLCPAQADGVITWEEFLQCRAMTQSLAAEAEWK